MNAGTCWGKNTIDPRGRGVERPRNATLTLTHLLIFVGYEFAILELRTMVKEVLISI
jgi:hypothetical protein